MDTDKDRSFLGKGWAFPPVFHTGVSPTAMVSDEEDIRQSLHIILSTRLGERVIALSSVRRYIIWSITIWI